MKGKKSEIISLLLKEKPVKALLELKGSEEKYASKIAKKIDCTYTHMLKILDEFERYGIVEFKKEGRIKEVILTDRGIDISHDLEGLVRGLEQLGAEDGG